MTGHILELLRSLLDERRINAAVLSIEGCGTSVIDSSEDIDRIGHSVIYSDATQSSQDAIGTIGTERVLDPKGCRIDPFDGVGKAFAMHYNKVEKNVDRTQTVDIHMVRNGGWAAVIE